MKRYNNFVIVGIDHGYGNIKTANTVTPTGITKLDAAPTFTKNTLYYDGSYYLIGEGGWSPVETSAEGRTPTESTAETTRNICPISGRTMALGNHCSDKRSDRQTYDSDAAVKAMIQIRDILMKSDKMKAYAKNNTVKDFEFSYFDDIDDALIEGLERNQDFFTMLLNDEEIKREILGIFTEEIYNSLKKAAEE